MTILVLVVFKYTNFFINNVNHVLARLGTTQMEQANIILPIGLSFIIFQACTYLGDVHKGNIQAEKNFIRYAAFVAFFPTVLSGPIQKARDLLPQIQKPADFDLDEAKKGTLLFVWGLFEKILVADRLLNIVNTIYSDYEIYRSSFLIVAGICFSLYIYADFSAYSDMARGVSKIMGIKINKNFDNPYLSTSMAEFWQRWHVSLNDWFVEYIYIPLGGNRKGTIRKYINIFIVFLISGLWHGAQYHFLAWGILNGLLVIIGHVVRPIKSKIYKKLNIDENLESIIFVRRAIVFWIITLTWVFFNNGINESIYIVKNMMFFKLTHFFNHNLMCIGDTEVGIFLTFIMTALFSIVQVKRQDETGLFAKYNRQPFLFQILIVAIIICSCIFGVCLTDASVNSQFLYFNF